jgi:WD40 repeat protein
VPGDWQSAGGLAFSQDGGILAVWKEKAIHFTGGPPLRDLSLEGLTSAIYDITFSPDGRHLACTSGQYRPPEEVTVWVLATGEQVPRPSGPFGHVCQLVYSPDGRLLAAVRHDATIKVWDVTSGKEVRTLPGGVDVAYRPRGSAEVVFSPDGRLLAGLKTETTVAVWDVLTGRELGAFPEHSAAVTAMAFSPGGHRLATGDMDGGVKVWNVP